jgi:hypothetical protein
VFVHAGAVRRRAVRGADSLTVSWEKATGGMASVYRLLLHLAWNTPWFIVFCCVLMQGCGSCGIRMLRRTHRKRFAVFAAGPVFACHMVAADAAAVPGVRTSFFWAFVNIRVCHDH